MATAVDVALKGISSAGITQNTPEGRPPFVRFEYRAIEDRNQSIEKGYWVGKDTVFALITPRGSKDVHEEVASEWLVKMAQEVREERFPHSWLEMFKQAHANFISGNDQVVNGLPLRDWPPIRPAQLRMCHAISIFSVEDLAAANEEALGGLGMGGRQLRDAAKSWLSAASSTGRVVAAQQALEASNSALHARNQSLEEQVRMLASRLDAMSQMVPAAQQAVSSGVSDLLDPPKPVPALKKV